MTQLTGKRSTWGRSVSACLALAVLMTGCVSASLEDVAPTQPSQAVKPEEKRNNSFVQEGALRNESYPTFEKMPVVATDQLSASDKQQLEAEMDAVRAAYGAGAISEARYRERIRELERLARTRGADAQKEIEN